MQMIKDREKWEEVQDANKQGARCKVQIMDS